MFCYPFREAVEIGTPFAGVLVKVEMTYVRGDGCMKPYETNQKV